VPATRLHRVAVLVLEGAKPLDVGIPAQVFTTRASMPYEVRVCGQSPSIRTVADWGMVEIRTPHGLDALMEADLVMVPGTHRFLEDPDPEAVSALRAAAANGVRTDSVSLLASECRSGKGCASSGGLRARILSSTIVSQRVGSTGCPTLRPSWSGSR